MRLFIGLLLLLIGAAFLIAGIVMGLEPLISLYRGALNNPLGQPGSVEQDTSHAMFHGLAIGAVGILPFLIGSALVKVSLFQKLRKKRARSRMS